jgi:hypothetical protein
MARPPADLTGPLVLDASSLSLSAGAAARPTVTWWFQFSAAASQTFQASQAMSLVYIEAGSAAIVSKIATAYTTQAATTVTKASSDVIAYASGQNFWIGNYKMKTGDIIYFVASTALIMAGIFALDTE